MRGDRGSIVVGWLTKLVLVLGVIGLLGFDVVSVAVTRVGTKDLAQNAAFEGAQAYRETRDVNKAYRVTSTWVADRGASIEPRDFVVHPDGSVEVTLRRTARSIVVYRMGSAKKWLAVEETARANPGP